MTFKDRNPVKRLIQRHRIADAISLGAQKFPVAQIVDFGAGNGELCRLLPAAIPGAKITCYEPHPMLIEQARERLKGIEQVTFIQDVAELAKDSADLVFCLEVFEHLPDRELKQAMQQLKDTLKPGGIAIVGVPVEIGFPALYKGIFRMFRRYGEFDARPGNIISATIGRPPKTRPPIELMPGSYFFLHHMGFDHRRLRETLAGHFKIVRTSASPFRWLGTAINSEAYFVLEKDR